MSFAEVSTITADDLLSLPDGEQYELIHGQLVERSLSHYAVWVIPRILYFLQRFLEENPLGEVYTDRASYRCFPHEPEMVRRPDISSILHGRRPLEQFLKGHARNVPDLVVEVLSPSDLAYDVLEKRQDYFQAGVPLIREVSPSTRTVMVYADGGRDVQHLQDDDEISGKDVPPGFVCRIREFFPPLDDAAGAAGGPQVR